MSDHPAHTETARANVLFFIGSMGGGGAERQIVEILKRLDRTRFCPLLYLHHRRGELLDEVPADVPIFSFWEHFTGTWRAKWHHLCRTTDRARWSHLARVIADERIDLVYSRTYLATLDAANACRQQHVSHVSACCCDPAEEIRLHAQGTLAAATANARTAFTSTAHIVAVSHGIQARLVAVLNVPHDLISVHANMIDVDESIRLSQAETVSLPADRFHLLTVARLSAEKGHQHLLKAVDQLVHERAHDDLLWHIVGTGPLEDDLRAEVSRRKLTNHVLFAGFQKNPYPYYRAADLFCLPSLHEAFGCVLVEALACGLPVLATDCPSGPREILNDGQYGQLVPPADSTALATAIEEFRANRQQWQAQGATGKEHVRQTNSFEAGMASLETLFANALD